MDVIDEATEFNGRAHVVPKYSQHLGQDLSLVLGFKRIRLLSASEAMLVPKPTSTQKKKAGQPASGS
jgi:hypothetical protein